MLNRIQSSPRPPAPAAARPAEGREPFRLALPPPAARLPAAQVPSASLTCGEPLRRVASTIERQRLEIDRAIQEAARGRSFTPAELVLLQARFFDYAESLEVLSQIVDKSVAAVKTTLSTQL